MSSEKDLLNCIKFFILDTKKNSLKNNVKVNEKDETFIKYHYNIHNYNKIVENSAFLYRMPSRGSKDRKFYIFGGGIIEKVIKDENAESEGEVIALIKNPFIFKKQIKQDNESLNKIKWELKNNQSANEHWGNFWSQYGILEISKKDFKSILNIQDTIEMSESDIYDYNNVNYNYNRYVNIDDNVNIFTINVFKNNKIVHTHNIDITEFKNNNFKKLRMHAFNEFMIVNYIAKILKKRYKTEVIIDNRRYDIVTYKDDESIDEIIEIHMTANGMKSVYNINKNELELIQKYDNYRIYNVFNLDLKKQSCDIEILGYKEIKNNYNLIPILYRLEKKIERLGGKYEKKY